MLTLPTWDLFITLCFLIGLGYGLILGRSRIVVTLIASYIGFAVANEIGNALHEILTGSTLLSNSIWIKSNISVFAVKTFLFAAIVVFLTMKGEFTATPGAFLSGMKGTLITALYSFLTSGLVISSIIYFLPQVTQAALLAQSSLAEKVFLYRNWWLFLPILLMVLVGTFGASESSSGE